MKFSCWWIPAAIVAFWVVGWLVTVIIGVFFNPLDTDKDKHKDLRERLVAHAAINAFLWPLMLPEMLDRRKLLRDMRTGKRPNWIMLAPGEAAARSWTLSDGLQFQASAASTGESHEPAYICGDYEDDRSLSGDVEYRVRMLAPTPGTPTEWARLRFIPRDGRDPEAEAGDASVEDDDGEDADDDDEITERYELSVRLPRGKYAVEFRVPNRSGTLEELSSVTLVLANYEDYNL